MNHFLFLHFSSFLLLPNISLLLSSSPRFWHPKRLLWKACQHVCQQNESNNWKNWPWILLHEQHIKGRLLCEIYRQGQFEVEERQLKRAPASPLTTHPSLWPRLPLRGRGKKQDRCLCAILSLSWARMNECCQTKSQSMVALFQMMNQSWSVGFKERGGNRMMAEGNAKGAGACACRGTWRFSYRKRGGIEELMQEGNFECASMCV